MDITYSLWCTFDDVFLCYVIIFLGQKLYPHLTDSIRQGLCYTEMKQVEIEIVTRRMRCRYGIF